MKKYIMPALTALGISATGTAGLFCALQALSCFMDGDPSRYPLVFPISVLAGLLCLAVFAFLIVRYVRLRRKAPSALWMAADAALALALAFPFLTLWLKLAALLIN